MLVVSIPKHYFYEFLGKSNDICTTVFLLNVLLILHFNKITGFIQCVKKIGMALIKI